MKRWARSCMEFRHFRMFVKAWEKFLSGQPGDMKTARVNNVKYFPINPGDEDKPWELFLNEAADKFHDGNYDVAYEAN